MAVEAISKTPARIGLEVRDLVRRYSADVVVGPISFAVNEGEFFSVLGPSGCGKTTLLRCIAGFERVDSGAIALGGARIENVPPHKRGIGLVFQTPALFPHLTVAQNVAFGLETHKIERRKARQRVGAILALVGLSEYGERMPNQLSGGQQQRVALARSLVLEPPLLLLDEPLSSLDLKLRVQMREELRSLQRRLRKTTIFVTHDQTEALALSDRIAVLSQGRIEQVGTPEEIYRTPTSRFVADFIGNSNLLEAEILGIDNGVAKLRTRTGLRFTTHKTAAGVSGRRVTLLIRPERMQIGAGASNGANADNTFAATLTDVTYLGEDIQYRLLVGGVETLLYTCKAAGAGGGLALHQNLSVHIDPSDVFVIAD
jgi:ABC-type Fe3+/spermidine/putrescine transport system ATPase subunit